MERLIKPVANLLGVISGLIIPLLAEGEVIGTLAIGNQRQLTESDIERLTVFTGHASLAIQKATLYNELLESREFLNNIIQSSVDGIIVTDMEMKIKMVNRAMLSLIGYRESELIGRSVLELASPRYRDSNKFLNGFQELLSKEKIDYFEGEIVNKAGEEIPIGISLALMRNNEGQASDIVGTIRDLREMKRLERKLIQSERLAAVGGLAAGTAHEINNPLANIMIYAQMARRKLDDDSLIKSNLGVIEEQASMAKRIVSNLLKFSRQSNPILRKTDLNDSINSVLRLLRYSLEAKGIEVQTDLQEDIPYVEADPGQLEQVFTNIIVNAKDAMARNGGKLTVRTRYNDRTNMIEVIFSDTGEGIPPENIPRLFDPFFTTKEVREGTGLGLSVSHGIIEDHKGTIEVESKVGVGSSFIIKLPALPQN